MADETTRPLDDATDADHDVVADTGEGGDAVSRTIHDAFFKQLFGDPRNAASLLRAITPPSIAEHLDWTSLRPAHASIVHERYRQTHGDLMFEARWKDETDRSRGDETGTGERARRGEPDSTGRGAAEEDLSGPDLSEPHGLEVFLQINVEHQSTVDRWMPLRGLDTTHGLWRRWRERHDKVTYLPAVLTYVFYHGASPWSAPTSLHDLIAIPEGVREALEPYLPSFRFLLDDIRTTSDDALLARDIAPYPKLAIVLMKHGSARDVAERLARFSKALEDLLANPRGAILLWSLLDYLWNVNDTTSERRLLRILSQHVGPELENAMIPYAQKLRQEGRRLGLEDGRKLGLEDGRKLGLEDGQRTILLHLLETRFHALPAHLRMRVESASDDEVKRWAVRVLDAESLEDVFEPA